MNCTFSNCTTFHLVKFLFLLQKIPTSVIVEEINDKHMAPWAEICLRDNTENTPLTPFMDGELIQNCHLNLSNDKLKETGYRLKVPILTHNNYYNYFAAQFNFLAVIRSIAHPISIRFSFSF